MPIFFCLCFLTQLLVLQNSSTGLGADGKDATCIIEEARADQGVSAFVETLPTQGEKKMEHANSSASDSLVPEQVLLIIYLTGVRFQLDSSLD